MKYLLCEAHGIGDCILILPIAKAIKEMDNNAYIKVFTKSDKKKIRINKSIMRLQHYVDEIEYYSKDEFFHSLKFLFKSMIFRYDFGIVIQDYDNEGTSSIPSKIVKLCCKKTCGTLIKNNKKIRYDYFVERRNGIRRDELFFEAANKIGINVKKNNSLDLLDRNIVDSYLPDFIFPKQNPVIVLVIGTAPVSLKVNRVTLSNNSKQWPYESWLNLAEKLAKSDYNIILLGGKKEKSEIDKLIFKFSNDKVIIGAGNYTIEESIAILNTAEIVVGADTGLMHCAGALGKKTLTLFGCTDHNEYLPFGIYSDYIQSNMECSPCFGKVESVICTDNICMKSITVDYVYKRIINKLINKE